MPKFKHYTSALVERQIKAIIRRNPNKVNPMGVDGTACVYHKGRGANIQRCLLGQWGFEQGFKTPSAYEGTISEVVDELWSKQAEFDFDAVDFMTEAQRLADGVTSSALKSHPVPWIELIS